MAVHGIFRLASPEQNSSGWSSSEPLIRQHAVSCTCHKWQRLQEEVKRSQVCCCCRHQC